MLKRTFAAVMTFVAMLCFTIAGEAATSNNILIYWYICGSNLEERLSDAVVKDSNGETQKVQVLGGQATECIQQMERVQLPPNVRVLINANGASAWAHPLINLYGNGLYLYDSTGLRKLSNWMADMGNVDTLRDFLKYGEENFPADRRILIFWDHGGVNGLCYDETFTGSPEKHNLTYNDLHKAMAEVYKNSNKKPFDLVVFNACMTGSYELANSIADFSKYMIGSEPSMYDFFYTDWFAELAKNPYMNGAQIGKVICDSSIQNYIQNASYPLGAKEVYSLNVLNLSKMNTLRSAFEKYFNKAKNFKGAFARAAESRTTEHYEDLYADLGTLAESTKDIMPKESEDLLKAIDSVVVYNCPGPFLNAKGISTYYPYDFNKNSELENFLTQKYTPEVQKNLYKNLMKLDVSGLDLLPVELNADNHVVAHINPKQLENVSKIRCVLIPWFEEGESAVGLEDQGAIVEISEEDLYIDWNTGTVTENFQALYPEIDGHRVNMTLSIAGRGYNIYDIPVILRGIRNINDQNILITRKGILQMKYDFNTKTYEPLGMNSQVVNGRVRERGFDIQEGDEITPLFMAFIPEDSLDAYEGNVIRYTNPKNGKSTLIKETLGETFIYKNGMILNYPRVHNGEYLYMFQFLAPNGSSVSSSPVLFKIEGNTITKTLITKEDMEEDNESAEAA